MQKKSLVSVLVCGAVIFTGCAHNSAPEGHYQQTPVVADGSTGDWTLPLRFSNADHTLQYTVTNDNKNLYICVLSNDDAMQRRILRAGMTLYFDPKGEKNKTISLDYPIRKPSDPQSYQSRNEEPATTNPESPDMKTKEEEWLLQSNFYNTTGFVNMENGQFGVTDKNNGVQVVVKLNNNDSTLVYEAVVPIKYILGADLNPKSAEKNFSVGIIVNAGSSGRRSGGGGYPRPSFGGMRGGMMGGGMGGGRRNYGSNGGAGKEDASWYPFRLVYPRIPGTKG